MKHQNSIFSAFAAVVILATQSLPSHSAAKFHRLHVVDASDTGAVLAQAEDALPIEFQALLQALSGNRFGLTESDLSVFGNPGGAGHFVYVEQTVFGGTTRNFVWFANGGTVSALNGATKNATPSLPFPREAPVTHLQDTGHGPFDLTSVAMELLF